MRKGCFWIFWIGGMLVCAAMVLGGLGYSIWARVINPDLSETRLFVQCWWAYALMIVGCFWGTAFLGEKPWEKR
jgi:Trk-type K+ transport system membrane component